MNRFEVAKPTTLAQAKDLVQEKAWSIYKAGGIDVIDHLKEHLAEPPRIVDLKSIPGLSEIKVEADGSLRIGALVKLADLAADERVKKTHAALAIAAGETASPQVRNVATMGGSVLQRPRCWYYRLEEYQCLKKGGEVCYAVGGENRYHVIFGGGPSYAVHPSNSAVALVALGASFVFDGPKGGRTVLASEFFQLPSKNAQVENTLGVGEILTEVRVPAGAGRSIYDEVRERQAFDWPLVSVAVALRLEGGLVKDARVVLGAVAPIPWRSNRAEAALMGKPLNEATLQDAGRAATVGAAPLSDNGYKVGLVQTLVRRTLAQLA
ncbi:MAG: xanthine dehydrogenase family protein subunit M [Vicinamibacteria bacterium]|nr:xanthine dehydrogenase family protein subunit M [Vicinamibacteria bacterium]